MTTKIFVMTHKRFIPPTEDCYIPLQVGRALSEDMGYLSDNTGDNISELNPYYGELTGLYWMWRNYHAADIVGVCHYRRYFWNENKERLTAKDYERILAHADIMVSNCITVEGSYLEYFGRAHNINDMIETGNVIRELYPEDYPAFCEVMNGNRQYFGNLCAMKKELFDEYCEWLFSIFAVLGDRVDVSGYDSYHRRLFGFLSENLLMVFVKARGLRVYEGRVGITDEKAETVELKQALAFLVKQHRVAEAKELFYNIIKIRPDIELDHSDVKRELPKIEYILNAMTEKTETQQHNLLEVSDDLFTLIQYV